MALDLEYRGACVHCWFNQGYIHCLDDIGHAVILTCRYWCASTPAVTVAASAVAAVTLSSMLSATGAGTVSTAGGTASAAVVTGMISAVTAVEGVIGGGMEGCGTGVGVVLVETGASGASGRGVGGASASGSAGSVATGATSAGTSAVAAQWGALSAVQVTVYSCREGDTLQQRCWQQLLRAGTGPCCAAQSRLRAGRLKQAEQPVCPANTAAARSAKHCVMACHGRTRAVVLSTAPLSTATGAL